MHEYILRNHKRWPTLYFIAIISSVIAAIIKGALTGIDTFNIPIAVPSGILIFTLLHKLFSKFVWNCDFFYDFGIFNIPDLNGEWVGVVLTDKGVQLESRITIHQTYNEISIILETEKTSSKSRMAMIDMINPTHGKLRYEYTSTYKGCIPHSIYNGVAEFELIFNENTKFSHEHKGFYYTSQFRDTNGNLTIRKKE